MRARSPRPIPYPTSAAPAVRPTAIPTDVAGIHSHETKRRSANHSAAPTITPAIRPSTNADPTESTPSTAKSATYPPIGKPTRIAIGQSHNLRAGLFAALLCPFTVRHPSHRTIQSPPSDTTPFLSPASSARSGPWSGGLPGPCDAVQDQIETVVELVSVVVTGLHGMFCDELDEVGVLVGGERFEHVLGHLGHLG